MNVIIVAVSGLFLLGLMALYIELEKRKEAKA